MVRAVMALLALCVALQGATPWTARVCAMHAASTALPVGAEADERHAHAGHPHHAPASPVREAAAPAHAPDEAPIPACDCLADCCGVLTLALTLPTAPQAEPMLIASGAAPHNPAPPRTAAADRLLPFANGPPPRTLG